MDRPGKKFDRTLLDEATHRDLLHWILTLNLDEELLQPGDGFAIWARRCGASVELMDEGGAVVRRPRGGAFLFISPDQYEALEKQLAQAMEAGDA